MIVWRPSSPLRCAAGADVIGREESGVCVWLTGLSASGKTTTALALIDVLQARACETVLLDGDQVRKAWFPTLGYSSADREVNVRHIGELARDAVERGLVAVCAVISPFIAGRDACRALVGADRFVEVYVSTPLAECERRDPKGLYARARRGDITQVCGIDVPYEAPRSPDLVLDTVTATVGHNVERILQCLQQRHLLALDARR